MSPRPWANIRVAVCFFLAGTTYGLGYAILEWGLLGVGFGDVVVVMLVPMKQEEEEDAEALAQVLNIPGSSRSPYALAC